MDRPHLKAREMREAMQKVDDAAQALKGVGFEFFIVVEFQMELPDGQEEKGVETHCSARVSPRFKANQGLVMDFLQFLFHAKVTADARNRQFGIAADGTAHEEHDPRH